MIEFSLKSLFFPCEVISQIDSRDPINSSDTIIFSHSCTDLYFALVERLCYTICICPPVDKQDGPSDS